MIVVSILLLEFGITVNHVLLEEGGIVVELFESLVYHTQHSRRFEDMLRLANS